MWWRHNVYPVKVQDNVYPAKAQRSTPARVFVYGSVNLDQIPTDAQMAVATPHKVFTGQWGSQTTATEVAAFVRRVVIDCGDICVEKIKHWKNGSTFHGCFHIYFDSDRQVNQLVALNHVFLAQGKLVSVFTHLNTHFIEQLGRDQQRRITFEIAESSARHATLHKANATS